MAISVTNIGTAQSQGGSLTITAGGGGVPAGSLIFASVMATAGTSLDNVTDSASRTYTQIQTQSFAGGGGGAGKTVYLANVSLPNNGTLNYANGSNNNVCMTACYATGIAPVPLDTAVTAKSTFSTTSSPTVTGGTPTHAGELVIGVLWSASSSATISSQGSFVTPPNFISVNLANGSTGGGNLVNAGSGTETYNPTLSASVNCAVCIQAFTPLVAWQGTANFNAAGNLLVPSVMLGLIASAEFDGAGSLSAGTVAHLSASTNFSGGPSLSAYGALALQILSEFDGAGSLTAIGTRIPPGGIVAIFSGGGSLSAIALQTLSASISLGGAGSLLPTVSLGLVASAVLAGLGGLHFPLVGTVSLNGGGSITVNAIQITFVAGLPGAGGLSVNGMRVISVVDQFNGSGRMCAQATVRFGRRGSVSNTVVAGRGSVANIALRGGTSSSKPFINYTAEDGVTLYTAEDGVTPYVTECP